MALIEILVEFKKGVADPAGDNARKTLEALGFEGIKDVRFAKTFLVEVDAGPAEAKKAGKEMCEKFFANPVIQKCTVTVR